MTRRLLFPILFVSFAVLAQDLKPVTLPPPKTEGGKPLLEALKERHSTREFTVEKLSPQMLSNLLWAAFGVNRADGRRTAPSASNKQEIDLFVALPEGMYRYEPKGHTLAPVVAGDLRAATGAQPFVGQAALNLVYIADFSKMGGNDESKVFYSAANTGFIAQNVYLFCASEGLGTVVRGMVDRARLAATLKLRPEQRIVLAQTVGYPKK